MHRRVLPYAKSFTQSFITIAALFALCQYSAPRAFGQGLVPKRSLTVGPAPGCEITAGQPVAVRRDNVEARRLAAAGQEAALIGDQTAARDAFARAAVLNPGDERVAYDLARAHEELTDSTKAIAEYCRYLTLSPAGREASDVRDRLVRLVPRAAAQRAEDVQVAFRLGLALYDDARYDAAIRAFDDVITGAPETVEGYFNRGLASAAIARRSAALMDLEKYRANAPTVDDRVEVGRAIEVLRRPVYSPNTAALRSLLPGFGEFYTARPIRGVISLVVVAGSAALAFTSQTTETQVPYVDPNGVPAPYVQIVKDRPYFTMGAATAVGVAVLSGIDAIMFAKRSQRGASIVGRAASVSSTDASFSSVFVAPLIDVRGRAGLTLSARF